MIYFSHYMDLASLIRSFFGCFRSEDWKAQLNIPAPDTRYKTEVKCFKNNIIVFFFNV